MAHFRKKPIHRVRKMTQISDFERELVAVVSRATFVPGTAPKRFIRDLRSGRIQNLSDKGRDYLAYVAHRFRKQYFLSAEQMAWITERLNNQAGLWNYR